MKNIAILTMALAVVGCDFSVHGYEINGYIKNCEDKQGVMEIDNITRTARCNNGEWVRWRND